MLPAGQAPAVLPQGGALHAQVHVPDPQVFPYRLVHGLGAERVVRIRGVGVFRVTHGRGVYEQDLEDLAEQLPKQAALPGVVLLRLVCVVLLLLGLLFLFLDFLADLFDSGGLLGFLRPRGRRGEQEQGGDEKSDGEPAADRSIHDRKGPVVPALSSMCRFIRQSWHLSRSIARVRRKHKNYLTVARVSSPQVRQNLKVFPFVSSTGTHLFFSSLYPMLQFTK